MSEQVWMPLLGTALLLVFSMSIILALAVPDWRYLIATAVSCLILMAR
jgi:cell division protein FtsW (lipid II flippase)